MYYSKNYKKKSRTIVKRQSDPDIHMNNEMERLLKSKRKIFNKNTQIIDILSGMYKANTSTSQQSI